MNKDILHHKSTISSMSLSLSPPFSFSEHPLKGESSSQCTSNARKRKMRIRKKTEKRIDILTESPIKNVTLKKRIKSDSDKSGSSDDLGAITWGSPKKKKKMDTQQEYCLYYLANYKKRN